MDSGHLASAALMLSGAAGIAIPERFVEALDLTPGSGRGITETRAGLGGTYAALGAYALLSPTAGAQRAIAATWLGAGVVRLAAMQKDRPRTDAVYWGSLAMELGLGAAALLAARKRR
ncbi:MAG: hypothetical protein ACJ72O_09115 [Marmoricola sp.]